MKFFFSTMLLTVMLLAFAGCQRERYQMGNVDAPKKGDAPDYSVNPDPAAPVQTR